MRKGEKSTPIIYADKIRKRDEETGEEKDIFFIRGYNVFNCEQVYGLPAHYYALADLPQLDPIECNARASAFVQNTGANVEYGGNSASYKIALDRIRMPHFQTFKTPEDFHTTELHELAHWSRHPSRLDRNFRQKRFER